MKNCRIVDLKDLIRFREEIKERKIVLTTGCFDILHAGHISFLKEAREQGDILIVGFNSDQSIKKIKGEKRPVIDEVQRCNILSAIRYIDYLFMFEDDTAEEAIMLLEPDIFAMGEESVSLYPSEVESAKKVNAELYIISRVGKCSTSDLIKKIKSL